MTSAAANPPQTHREATFRALLLAVFLAAMEATIVSTALPRIVAELGGLALYGWVGSAYLLAATVTMPLYGRLADLYGRKPVFQLGLAFFFLGSALCGGARSIALLLAGRAVQGLGAGSIQPVAMTIIGDLYPVEERAKVQGIIGSIWAVAGVAGPFLGALLVDGPGWRWVFWINLPFALLSGVLLHRALHDRPAHGERRGLDLPGAALLIAASVALLLAGEGFLPLATATVGVVATVAFVRVERRSPAPLLPLPLLARPEVSISSAAAAASGALLMGFVIYLPLYLQGVRGLAPAASGMVLGPLLVGWPAASTWSIRRVRRVGFRRTAVTGAVLIAVGMVSVSLALLGRAPVWAISSASLLVGLGLGFAVTSMLVALQTRVEFRERGIATATNLFARSLGSALGVGALGALLHQGLGSGAVAEEVRRQLAPGARAAHVALDSSAVAVLGAALEPVWWTLCALAIVHALIVFRYPRDAGAP